MRQDQHERLQELAEKLTDEFLSEAEPGNWPGCGVKPSDMDKATRGDRVWCKKDAAATLVIIMKISSLTSMTGPAGEDHGDSDGGLEGEIAQAEKEASQWLKKIQKQASKTK